MCGIVGATAQRPVSEILLSGLHSLEYRGYDSAGIALLDDGQLYLSKPMAVLILVSRRQSWVH